MKVTKPTTFINIIIEGRLVMNIIEFIDDTLTIEDRKGFIKILENILKNATKLEKIMCKQIDRYHPFCKKINLSD